MEYIDVLNDCGVKTGEILPRDEVHKRGLWHRAIVVAIINSENKVLMQQRSDKKEKFPGLWDLSAAGHVMSGEDSTSAVLREVNEEVGFSASRSYYLKKPWFTSSFKNIHQYQDSRLGVIYEKQFYDMFVIFDPDDKYEFKFKDGEVQNAKWMSLFEIKDLQKAGKLHPRTEWIGIVADFLSKKLCLPNFHP